MNKINTLFADRAERLVLASVVMFGFAVLATIVAVPVITIGGAPGIIIGAVMALGALLAAASEVRSINPHHRVADVIALFLVAGLGVIFALILAAATAVPMLVFGFGALGILLSSAVALVLVAVSFESTARAIGNLTFGFLIYVLPLVALTAGMIYVWFVLV